MTAERLTTATSAIDESIQALTRTLTVSATVPITVTTAAPSSMRNSRGNNITEKNRRCAATAWKTYTFRALGTA